MITTITKSDFERALPVGTSSHDNIFEMVLPEIEARLSFLNDRMLGNEGIKIVDDAGKDGMIQRNFIRLAVVSAFLSVMLAVINILPIPALDGGHLLFTIYEMITGHKQSDKFLISAQTVGMFLLLAIMILAFGNDIARLFN